ncbi:unnamed protein product, partial [Owenia fusiformis]
MDVEDIHVAAQTRNELQSVLMHKTTEQDKDEHNLTPTTTPEPVTLISNGKVPYVSLDRIEALDKIAKYNAKSGGNIFTIHLSNIKFDTFTKGRPTNEPCDNSLTESYIIDETYKPCMIMKEESGTSFIKHVKSEPHSADIFSNTTSETCGIECQSKNRNPNKENISEINAIKNDLFVDYSIKGVKGDLLTGEKTKAKTDNKTSITTNIPYIPICIQEEDKSDINLKDVCTSSIDKTDYQTSDDTNIPDRMGDIPICIKEEENNSNFNLKDLTAKTDYQIPKASNIPNSIKDIQMCIKYDEDSSTNLEDLNEISVDLKEEKYNDNINLKDVTTSSLDKTNSQTTNTTNISDLLSYDSMCI